MATETLSPDGVLDSTDFSVATLSFIQDDPDSPDGNWWTWDGNGNTVCRVSFPTPTGTPTVGAGLQEIRALIRADTGSGTNTVDWSLELYENGSQVAVLNTGSGLGGSTIAVGTFNANLLGTADGSLVEVAIVQTSGGTGTPSGRRGLEPGALVWNAVSASAPGVAPQQQVAPANALASVATALPSPLVAVQHAPAVAYVSGSRASALLSATVGAQQQAASATASALASAHVSETSPSGIGIIRTYRRGAIDTIEPINRLHPLARGLRAFWIMLPGDRGGTRVVDLWGRHHATLGGNTSKASVVNRRVPFGAAVNFPGEPGDYLTPVSFPLLTGDFTLVATFLTRSAHTRPPNGEGIFVANDTGSASKISLFTNHNSAGQFTLTTDRSGVARARTAGGFLASNQWYHVVATDRNGGPPRLWFDGVEPSYESQVSRSDPIDTYDQVFLGRSTVDYDYWDGRIGFIALYDRYVTTPFARQHYEETVRGFPTLFRRLGGTVYVFLEEASTGTTTATQYQPALALATVARSTGAPGATVVSVQHAPAQATASVEQASVTLLALQAAQTQQATALATGERASTLTAASAAVQLQAAQALAPAQVGAGGQAANQAVQHQTATALATGESVVGGPLAVRVGAQHQAAAATATSSRAAGTTPALVAEQQQVASLSATVERATATAASLSAQQHQAARSQAGAERGAGVTGTPQVGVQHAPALATAAASRTTGTTPALEGQQQQAALAGATVGRAVGVAGSPVSATQQGPALAQASGARATGTPEGALGAKQNQVALARASAARATYALSVTLAAQHQPAQATALVGRAIPALGTTATAAGHRVASASASASRSAAVLAATSAAQEQPALAHAAAVRGSSAAASMLAAQHEVARAQASATAAALLQAPKEATAHELAVARARAFRAAAVSVVPTVLLASQYAPALAAARVLRGRSSPPLRLEVADPVAPILSPADSFAPTLSTQEPSAPRLGVAAPIP